MFGLLHTHSLTFDGRDAEDGDVWSFRFHTNAPLRWRAGQHGLLRLSGLAVKPFTLASAPEEDSILIGTSLRSNSTYKQKLAALDEGDRVVFHGPLARFTLDGAGADVVMLAQGIGITPFRSMLRHLALGGDAVSATLIHVGAGHAYPPRHRSRRHPGVLPLPRRRLSFDPRRGRARPSRGHLLHRRRWRFRQGYGDLARQGRG